MPTSTPTLESVYTKYERIGRGSSGDVYRGVNNQTGQLVAIKVLELDTNDGSLNIDSIRKEIRVLAACSSPHIIRYHGSYLVDHKLWIIMDYCGAGSLRQILDRLHRHCLGEQNSLLKEGCGINEDLVLAIARQVLLALAYIHKNNIIHRDIKAANILLSEDGMVKLGDFGVASQMVAANAKRKSLVGSPYWMAPEVIREARYDWRADIWSFGIALYELLLGRPPLSTVEAAQAIHMIPRNSPPRLDTLQFSKNITELVHACLQIDPHNRPSAEVLLKSKPIKLAKKIKCARLFELAITSQRLASLSPKEFDPIECIKGDKSGSPKHYNPPEKSIAETGNGIAYPRNNLIHEDDWNFEIDRKAQDAIGVCSFRLVGHHNDALADESDATCCLKHSLGSKEAVERCTNCGREDRCTYEYKGHRDSSYTSASGGDHSRSLSISLSNHSILSMTSNGCGIDMLDCEDGANRNNLLEEEGIYHSHNQVCSNSGKASHSNKSVYCTGEIGQYNRHRSSGSLDKLADFKKDCQDLNEEEKDNLQLCMVYGNMISQSWDLDELRDQLADATKIEALLANKYRVRACSKKVLDIALGFIIKSREGQDSKSKRDGQFRRL